MIAAGGRARRGAGLAPAFAAARDAARPRRAAVRARRGRLVVDRRPDAGHGRRARGRRSARFGWFLGVWVVMMARDDVPVGRADGRAVLAHDQAALAALAAALHRGLPARVGAPRASRRSRSRAASQRDRRRRARVGPRRPLGRRRDARRRGGLRADAAQGRLPRQVPQPARLPAGLLARRAAGARCRWARSTARGASAAAGR